MNQPQSRMALIAFVSWSTACASVPPGPGATPTVEVSLGFVGPQLPQAESPGLTGSIAYVLPKTSSWGAALVADAEGAYLLGSLAGGARVYGRTRPLFNSHRTLTYFGQLLAGNAWGDVSGVLRSDGGLVIEPGVGLDYGQGRLAFRLHAGYRHVAGGAVYDARVSDSSNAPIDRLSGTRVVLGLTWRILSR